MKHFTGLLLVILWLLGIVLAKGFWSTFFAVVLPVWGWYLVVEHFAIKFLL